MTPRRYPSPGDGFAEAVLDLVDRIPPGRVLTYGDVAEYLGVGGPRQVGRVMSTWGSTVPWWRVVRAGGLAPRGHEAEAMAHYRQEATPVCPERGRLDLRLARWDGR